jgi:hypothetical protein
MNFDSLRHEISHLVHEASKPLSKPELQEMCSLADNEVQLANCIFNMCKADELVRHPAPEGSGRAVKWCYGPGENKPGADGAKTPRGGGDPEGEKAEETAARPREAQAQGA